MKRKIKKQVTVRLDSGAAEWLGSVADTTTAGATTILEAAPTLYRQALAEVRGQFSESECELILDALNGVCLAGGLAGQHLHANVADHISLNAAHKKWGVGAEKISHTIGRLTSFQRAAVELWGAAFWRGKYSAAEFARDHLALITG